MHPGGETIRRFLQNPLDRSCFRSFFDLCHSMTVGLLKYYRSRGIAVPIEQADHDKALSDLAITMLGEFMQSHPQRPFELIFDYFDRHEMSCVDDVPVEQILDQFRILLSGFVKKRLFRWRKTENPQAEILKRRIKDILQPPEYERYTDENGNRWMVALATGKSNSHGDGPIIPFDQLLILVQEAYLHSHTRTAWCHAVFAALERESAYRHALILSDLLLAMVEVNARELEEVAPCPSRPLSPEIGAVLQSVDRIIDATLIRMRQSPIASFYASGRITETEGEGLIAATRLYLMDLGYGGSTDSLPQYFRETMPVDEHERYIKRYKYVFESIVAAAVADFREQLARKMT